MSVRRNRVTAVIAGLFACLLGGGFEASQNAPATQKPPMAENVYLNIQVLKGIPVDQFNDTMGMFASALLLDCVGCHDGRITSDPKAFALSTPRIERARQMVVMMNNINRLYFGASPVSHATGAIRSRSVRRACACSTASWSTTRRHGSSSPMSPRPLLKRCSPGTSKRRAARSGWQRSEASRPPGRTSGSRRAIRRCPSKWWRERPISFRGRRRALLPARSAR